MPLFLQIESFALFHSPHPGSLEVAYGSRHVGPEEEGPPGCPKVTVVGSRLGSEPPGHQYRRGDPTELRDHPETEAHQFTVVHVGLYRASQSKCDSGCETGPAPPPALAPSSLLSDQAAMLPRAPSAGKTPFPSAPPPHPSSSPHPPRLPPSSLLSLVTSGLPLTSPRFHISSRCGNRPLG